MRTNVVITVLPFAAFLFVGCAGNTLPSALTGSGAPNLSSGAGTPVPLPPPEGPPPLSPPPSGPPPAIQVHLTPSNRTTYVNGVQTITAQVMGSHDSGVSFAITGGTGTLIGNGNTVGVQSNTTGTVRVTATANADHAATSTAAITFAPAPTPNTSHPRIMLTKQDVIRLQSWYNNGNPIYANGMAPMLVQQRAILDPHWSWTYQGGSGLPDATWASWDFGHPGFATRPDAYTEVHMGLLAFASLVDTDPTKRQEYASMAHDMLMWVMNQAASPNAPNWHAPTLPVGDRMRLSGWAWGATVDWIYPTLTAQDKQTIGTVFHAWAKAQLTTGVTTSQFPQPVGSEDNAAVLTSPNAPMRWAMNNHSIGASRALMFESIALDDNQSDDPTLSNCSGGRYTVCGDGSANSVRAYLKDWTGAWLLRDWAVYENPQVVASAYKSWLGTDVSNLKFGEGAGGTSLEGTEYDEAMGILYTSLLTLHTAGLDDPAIYGPQVALFSSSYWDLRIESLIHQVSPVVAHEMTELPRSDRCAPVHELWR